MDQGLRIATFLRLKHFLFSKYFSVVPFCGCFYSLLFSLGWILFQLDQVHYKIVFFVLTLNSYYLAHVSLPYNKVNSTFFITTFACYLQHFETAYLKGPNYYLSTKVCGSFVEGYGDFWKISYRQVNLLLKNYRKSNHRVVSL